jgi:hypothetical protein
LGFGGGRATPISVVWGGRNHLQGLGGKGLETKKKKKKVWVLGVAGSPPKALGRATPILAIWGGSATPKRLRNQKQKKQKKKFGFWGWPNHPGHPPNP